MKTFVLVSGDGVPGLPHEITDQQAKEQGLTALLQAAVDNGTYKEKPAKAAKVKESNNGQ